MAEWTPEARRRLAEYLDRVAALARLRDWDAQEIVEELKAHVMTETEVRADAVVTLDHVEQTLVTLGTPEQVLGQQWSPTMAPSGCDPIPHVVHTRRPWRELVLIFGIGIPAFSMMFELASGTMASLYRDPIPTVWHFAAGVVLLVGLGVAQYGLQTPKFLELPRGTHWIFLLNGYATLLAFLYFLRYLPVLPIAAVAVIALGLGLMGFSPLFCTLSGLYQMCALYRRLPELGLTRPWAMKRTVAGMAIVMLLVVVVEGPGFARAQALRMAISPDPEISARGLSWLRTLHGTDHVLEACYQPFTWRGPLNRWDEERATNWHAYEKVYFQLTGTPFNSVPAPRMGVLGRSARWWDMGGAGDSAAEESMVSFRVKGLALASSHMDISLGAVDGTAEPALAYLEWILEFRNSNPSPCEARAQLALPHDAVASRLTLWIEGEEREAAFGARQQVREAYREVVVRRRDPALLTATRPDHVMLQCFPVPGCGVLKAKVGITAPVVYRDGNAYLKLPYFAERNFAVSRDFVHGVWAEGSVPFLSSTENMMAEQSPQGVYALRGNLTDRELEGPHTGALIMPVARFSEYTSSGVLGTLAATMTVYPKPGELADNGTICLVVDGSALMAKAEIDWMGVVKACPQSVKINVVFAGADMEIWASSFAPASEELAQWLSGRQFGGGCDNVPALAKARELVSGQPQAALVWIHGPSPVELSSLEELAQWLRRRPVDANGEQIRLFSVAVIPGPDRILERLGYTSGMEVVPMLESPQETLEYVLGHLALEDVSRTFVLQTDTETAAAASSGSNAHIVRLAIGDLMKSALRTEAKDEMNRAKELALAARLVTPLTGAVVLETKAQYDRHGLNPQAHEEAIPGIPEPEEWALLAVAAVVLAFILLRRRRTLQVH